ncbi:MAG: MATE family efflux transporter [Gammaproteobacteria bacterium]|nr:MATE family efflux transporter [Gammaproteobacteria bacterium]
MFKRVYELLTLMIPLIFIGLVAGIIYFMNNIFLAHLNPTSFAAGGLVGWLYSVFFVIIYGILGSLNVLVSHEYGQKNIRNITHILRDGFICALLLAVPSFILFWNIADLFLWLGQAEEVVYLARPYLHALAIGILPNLFVISILETLIGVGHIRTVFQITLVSVVLTVCFSYAFIFGQFGFPMLGVAGAGWGITCGSVATMIFVVGYIYFDKPYQSYMLAAFNLQKPSFIYDILKIGFPIGLMYFIEVGFFFVMSILVGQLGHEYLAANQVALQYVGMMVGVLFNLTQGITVRIGHLLGGGGKKEILYTIGIGVIFSVLLVLLIALINVIKPQLLISIDFDVHDSKNILLISYAKTYISFAMFFLFFQAVRLSLFAALRAYKDTIFLFWASLITVWFVALPLGHYLAHSANFGVEGYWIGMIIAGIFSCFLFSWRLYLLYQKQNDRI